jgi:transposase
MSGRLLIGGKRRVDDRAALAAIVYLIQAGCSWPKLPAELFGISRSTAPPVQ